MYLSDLIKKMLTGHNNDTLKLVVAISLSGSAVNFSFTVGHEQKHVTTHATHYKQKTFTTVLLRQLENVDELAVIQSFNTAAPM